MASRVGTFISKSKNFLGNFASARSAVPKFRVPDGGLVYNAMRPLKLLFPKDQAINPLNLFGIRYNYCGPMNTLDNGPPTNKTDAICEKHDYAYDKALSAPRSDQKALFRNADNQMLENLQSIDDFQDMNERLGYYIAKGGISAKIGIEDTVSKLGSFFS